MLNQQERFVRRYFITKNPRTDTSTFLFLLKFPVTHILLLFLFETTTKGTTWRVLVPSFEIFRSGRRYKQQSRLLQLKNLGNSAPEIIALRFLNNNIPNALVVWIKKDNCHCSDSVFWIPRIDRIVDIEFVDFPRD